MKRTRRRSGFSLVELMIAMVITALAIAAAAKIAGSAVRSSRRGTETTDLGQRARVLSRQLRADLRLAGEGSTGSIGVAAVAPWTTLSIGFNSVNGFASIPAITGANNIAGATAIVGNTTPNYVTDAIQLVVPDPSTRQETTLSSPRLAGAIVGTVAMTCPTSMIYISDHAAPNGAGKTQIAQITNGTAPISLAAGETLLFEVGPGAQIMCARVSTYWIGTPAGSTVPWLHRSDLTPGAAITPVNGAAGRVYVPTVAAGADLAAPGVYDLQVAYELSSEVGAPITRLSTPAQRWAFAPGGIAAPVGRGWFEVRQVRFNLLVTNLRQLTETQASTSNELAVEDGAAVPLPIERGRFRLSAAETLNTLRFFDKVVPAGVAAEPY